MHCVRNTHLTAAEKRALTTHLEQQGLADNIWDLFDEWTQKSTREVDFFYLKVQAGGELQGLGMFVQIKSVDLRSFYAALRKDGPIDRVASFVSRLSRNSVVCSFRNMITANHTRPFFFTDPGIEDAAMGAMLKHLRTDTSTDIISVVDAARQRAQYKLAGFAEYPCPAECWFDVTRYQDISDYLGQHRNLKKNLKRRRSRITVEVRHDTLSPEELSEVHACIDCSVQHSMVTSPYQQFVEENIFSSQVYCSNKYVHILVRVDGVIAGFHTFHISGSSMGGVLGGFNRELSRNNFVYERVIVASLDYAIRHRLRRIHYSLADNQTKIRLVDLREPCGVFYFARNPVYRNVFKHTFKYTDVHALWRLENSGG